MGNLVKSIGVFFQGSKSVWLSFWVRTGFSSFFLSFLCWQACFLHPLALNVHKAWAAWLVTSLAPGKRGTTPLADEGTPIVKSPTLTAGYLMNYSLINMPISQVSEAAIFSELGAQVHVWFTQDVFSIIPCIETVESMWVYVEICSWMTNCNFSCERSSSFFLFLTIHLLEKYFCLKTTIQLDNIRKKGF